MNQKNVDAAENSCGSMVKRAAVVPVPLLPPLPHFHGAGKAAGTTSETESITNREIANFWRRKRLEEEDHLLAAIKAAARVRAYKLSEDDYKRFIESLEDADEDVKANSVGATDKNVLNDSKSEHEVRVGIKDWWTKSKYAYLNQPALESMDIPRRRASSSSYTPNCFSYKPAPLYPTSLGVF